MYQSDPTILLIITLVLLILVTFRSLLLQRAVQRTRVNLSSTVKKLENITEELDRLKEKENRFDDFSSDLLQAEIATRVQRSRCAFPRSAEAPEPPEKYRYIHSLASRGVGAADIGAIFAISSHEADQLVKLANLSRSD